MLLFVGLGNPTPDSENNRHNVGFKIIDSINKKFGLSKQKPKFKGLLTTGNIGNEKVYAIKPLTFMNNSGICIRDRPLQLILQHLQHLLYPLLLQPQQVFQVLS